MKQRENERPLVDAGRVDPLVRRFVVTLTDEEFAAIQDRETHCDVMLWLSSAEHIRVTIQRESERDPASDACDCDCHIRGGCHIEPCCEGICEGCHRNIRFGQLSGHRRQCVAWIAWARKQKRDNLKRLGVWTDFEAVR